MENQSTQPPSSSEPRSGSASGAIIGKLTHGEPEGWPDHVAMQEAWQAEDESDDYAHSASYSIFHGSYIWFRLSPEDAVEHIAQVIRDCHAAHEDAAKRLAELGTQQNNPVQGPQVP